MIVYTLAVFVIIASVARLANTYQARWQEQQDEEDLLLDVNLFLAGWGRYDQETDARYNAVVGEAELLAERERIRQAAEEAEAEGRAVPDSDLIAGFANAIHRSAIYNGKEDAPIRPTRKQLDKAMFKGIEERKHRQGILSMSDELHG